VKNGWGGHDNGGFGRLSNGRHEEADCGQRQGHEGTGPISMIAPSAPLIGREKTSETSHDELSPVQWPNSTCPF